MTPDWGTIIASALIGVLGAGAFWTFLQYLLERKNRRVQTAAEARKTEAEAGELIASANKMTIQGVWDLVTHLKNDVSDLRQRVNEQDRCIEEQGTELTRFQGALSQYAARVAHLTMGIAELFRQISESGSTPRWKPDDWTPPDIGA